MNNRLYAVLFLFPLVFTIACESQHKLLNVRDDNAQNLEADVTAIRAVWQTQEKVAYNTGDVEACADTTEDAVFIPENSPPIVGQSAIRAWCENGFEVMVFDVDPVIDELVVEGDMAYVVGTWRGRTRPKKGGDWMDIDNGTIAIYRRQEDGIWKLARTIWNSNKSAN